MIALRDPRLRILSAIALVACISQLASLPIAATALGLTLLFALHGKGGQMPWRRLLHVEGFLLLILVMLPFTVPGEPVLRLGPLSASAEGFARALLVACKVSASAIILMVLLRVDDPAELGGALRALHVPGRLVRLFLLAARHVALLGEETRRLQDAMRMRGFHARSDRHTWRSYGNLVGMILVRSLDRAQRIEEAMLCRSACGRFPAPALPMPVARDWAGFALLLILAIAIAFANWS